MSLAWKQVDLTHHVRAFRMALPSGVTLELSERAKAKDGSPAGWYLGAPGFLAEDWLFGAGAELRDVQIFALGAAIGHLMRVRSELADAARGLSVPVDL